MILCLPRKYLQRGTSLFQFSCDGWLDERNHHPGVFAPTYTVQEADGARFLAITLVMQESIPAERLAFSRRITSAFCTSLSIHTDDPVWLRIGVLPPSSKADIPDHEMAERPVFVPYTSPPAAGAPARHLQTRCASKASRSKGFKTLLSMNQPDGFDCSGCAIPHSAPSV